MKTALSPLSALLPLGACSEGPAAEPPRIQAVQLSFAAQQPRTRALSERDESRIYLGTGDVRDFDVPRNTELDYLINIRGENTSDLRVTVAVN